MLNEIINTYGDEADNHLRILTRGNPAENKPGICSQCRGSGVTFSVDGLNFRDTACPKCDGRGKTPTVKGDGMFEDLNL